MSGTDDTNGRGRVADTTGVNASGATSTVISVDISERMSGVSVAGKAAEELDNEEDTFFGLRFGDMSTKKRKSEEWEKGCEDDFRVEKLAILIL